jgi:S1-C subfamily serine protease
LAFFGENAVNRSANTRRTFSHVGLLALAALVCVVSLLDDAHSQELAPYIVIRDFDRDETRLSAGAPILATSSIRLQISAPVAGTLSVSFKAPGRERVTIVDEQLISTPTEVALPSNNHWYELDAASGVAAFEVTLTSKDRKLGSTLSFLQVAPDFGSVPSVRDVELTQAEYQSVAQGVNGETRSASELKIASLSLKRLQDMLRTSGVALRGAEGARLFREYSRSVVLIVTESGIGSGVVIDDKGRVVTNWHVVDDNKEVGVVVKPVPGQRIQEKDIFLGRVVRVDQLKDLAYLTVSGLPKDIRAIPMGKLEEIEVGADVHAIGHPKGETWTYTTGVISQLRAGYKWPGEGFEHEATVVQTQTPINPGNSGGPLFSERGNLIGINSFVRLDTQGLNYAVSVRDVDEFLRSKSDRILAKKSDAKNCSEPKKPVDRNKNGKPDGVLIDTDCDGKFETFVVDADEDGKPDYILKDTKGDGKFDLKITKSDPNGKFDLWLLDEDGDGKPDIAGTDSDGDGKPDKFRRLS